MNVLEGKVAIVTGASSGIGRATARLFADEGAAVVATARRQAELNSLVSEIEASGGQAIRLPAMCAKKPRKSNRRSGGRSFRRARHSVQQRRNPWRDGAGLIPFDGELARHIGRQSNKRFRRREGANSPHGRAWKRLGNFHIDVCRIQRRLARHGRICGKQSRSNWAYAGFGRRIRRSRHSGERNPPAGPIRPWRLKILVTEPLPKICMP